MKKFVRSSTLARLKKLNAELKRIMSDPEMQKKLSDLGLIPIDPLSTAETVRYIKSETEKWSSLVKRLGLAGSQ